MESEKKLMYVASQSHENNISLATLRNKGWQVYTVPHIENAISMLQAQSLHVGLIHLELTLAEARGAAERDVIKRSLRVASHNVSQAARLLGISRGMLYHLIAKYGISARAPDT